MRCFVAVSGGRIKKLSNRPGGNLDSHPDYCRKEDLAKLTKLREATHLVVSLNDDEIDEGIDRVAEVTALPTSFPNGASCGLASDPEVGSNGHIFIPVEVNRLRPKRQRDFRRPNRFSEGPRPWQPKSRLLRLIEDAKHVAGRSNY